jgi:hypothetical protein
LTAVTSITLPRPPREQSTSKETEEQWREHLYKSIQDILSGLQFAEINAGDAPVTAAGTLDTDQNVVFASAAGGAFTYTLHTAVGYRGKIVRVVKTDATSNQLTVAADGAETIFGQASIRLSGLNDCVAFISDDANWLPITPEGHLRTVSAIVVGNAVTPTSSNEIGAWVSALSRTNIGYYGITARTGTFSSAPAVSLVPIRALDNDRYSLGVWLDAAPTATAIGFYTNYTDEQQADPNKNQRDDSSSILVIARGPR